VGDLPAGYPAELTEQAWLEDGTAVLFRAVRPGDAERFERLFDRLSPETVYRRFFAPVARLQTRMLERLVNVDYHDRLALVAEIGGEVAGVARYDRLGGGEEAEAAVIVEDAWQGRGIGTRLLWRLSAAARERGVRVFVGSVLADNRPMMGLLRELAEDVTVRLEGGLFEFRARLDPPPRAG
jgi:predicted N-acetyltransferase YhbS